jgi:2-methylcitrate dehydratase PrpD
VTYLRRMADFIAEPGLIPAAATDRAKLALVDLVGVTIAGTLEPVVNVLLRHVQRSSGDATIIGAGRRVTAPDAALVNSTAGHALDLDDSNFVLGGHPTVTMLPALLALGEERRLGGVAVLEAYVVGFEVMMALARAVNFEHYEKGWHPSATIGTFGTAAAVARLLRLDAERARHALGLACSMAAGIKANFGTMAKPFQLGQASRNGMVAALLARDGLTASDQALEGKQGFLAVYNGPGHFRAEALACPGEPLEILKSGIAFKKYACCGSTHAPVDAALSLVRESGVRGADVAAATIAINARRLPHVNRPVVEDPLQAKFSVQYAVAAALTDGAVGLGQFSAMAVQRAEVQDLLRRVEARGLAGAEALSQGVELTVVMHSGATHRVRLEDAEGRNADDYPSYMRAKFDDCVTQRFTDGFAAALLPDLLRFEHYEDIGPLMARLGDGGGA